MNPVDKPILVVKVGWPEDEGDGMAYQVIVGDDEQLYRDVQPWMLEAVVVAGQALELTKAKIERAVLWDFIERGRKEREVRKKFQPDEKADPERKPN